MGRSTRVVALLAVIALSSACGERIKKPGSSDLVLAGSVFALASGGGNPLSGAEVRAGVDRNGDGQLTGDEAVSVTTDDDGKYSLSMKVNAGEKLVVRFSGDGVAPYIKTIKVAPWAELPLNASLRQLESLDCDSEGMTKKCALDGNKVSLTGLADGTRGDARLFNPVKEINAFPGAFDDADGNLLLSNSFTSINLERNGEAVTTLDTPADLRMRIPQETWKLIMDLHPGNDRIEIPLYAFDEAKGEWLRQGEGFLETSAGGVIPEAKLAEIRAGTFTEGVTACGKVSHFSYWNVDWPISTKQCVTGVILGDDDKPAEGATVTISGVTYTGISEPVTVGADGRFCADVMKSEAPGEDVDQDGISGETQRVRLRISYGGKLYDGGEVELPTNAATCEGGGCHDLGDVKLEVAKELVPSICKVTGKVKDNLNAPVEGVHVFFSDPSVPEEVRSDLCGFASLNCTLFAISGSDGTYEVSTPVLDGSTLIAFSSTEDTATKISRLRFGTNTTDGCPTEPVDLLMNEGFDSQRVDVTIAGNLISWTPDVGLHSLQVSSSSSNFKWAISSGDDSGFKSPVTYGTVPANAKQLFPDMGAAPAPLQSGDSVLLLFTRENDNIPLVGTGSATVP